MNPVALIAPYQEMAEIARGICREFKKAIVIEVGDLREGLMKGRLLVERGAEIIISRGGTAQLLRAELPVPVVEIKVTAYDILRALQKVPGRGQKIGIIGFGNIIYGTHELGDLLDLDLTVFTIRKEEDVPITLEEAKKKKVDIIIGDKVVASHASRNGQKSVLIESGRESILQSFHEAYEILSVIRAEAQKSREYVSTLTQLKAVLDSVQDQVVILDSQDRIQSCNPAALRIFNKDQKQIQGLPLFLYPVDPLKKMKKNLKAQRHHLACIRGKYVLLDYTPIETNGERTGALIVGRCISELQQAERKVRNELHLKGHVARYRFPDIHTADDNFQKTINRGKRFSSSASTVLILGETGTGKEMFAQSIHNERFGPERPFVAINCATLPESLLESELFGYAEGAFTGAKKRGKKGFFELAHGGTLLLDEIGELPLNLQSRLLRVIEEREIQRLGDDRVIPVDVCIIASTNKDLAQEVEEKRFRGDLFYRLNVLELKVPPLRERGRDAYILFRHFVLQINPNPQKRFLFSKEVERLLSEYQWPGNVREVKNLVERLAILTDNFSHSLQDITESIGEELKNPGEIAPMNKEHGTVNLNLKEVERLWIKQLDGSSTLKRRELAKRLGISRTTLWKKLKVQ